MQNISINIKKKEFLNSNNKASNYVTIKDLNLNIQKGQFC